MSTPRKAAWRSRGVDMPAVRSTSMQRSTSSAWWTSTSTLSEISTALLPISCQMATSSLPKRLERTHKKADAGS